MPRFLHVGCGQNRKPNTTRAFNTPDWEEVRFDIDPGADPDILGTMTDMSAVADGSFDALYSAHNIEHLYPYEVPIALAEFRRVLAPTGFCVITCPDLQSVAAMVAEDRLLDVAYQSPAGPITPLDIIYGHRASLARGNHYMAHRCGFTQKVLDGALRHAGFTHTGSFQRPAPFFELWSVATCEAIGEEALRSLALAHFPGVGG